MANDQFNAIAEVQVSTGWAYVQSWSSPWGPLMVGSFQVLNSFVGTIYSN